MNFNNYEIASSDTNHIKETWDKILDSNAEHSKIQEAQEHEIKLKQMEIQAQKDLFFYTGIIISLILIVAIIIYFYRTYNKKKLQSKDKIINSIKDKMEILNSLLDAGVITKEEFDLQKDKLINN